MSKDATQLMKKGNAQFKLQNYEVASELLTKAFVILGQAGDTMDHGICTFLLAVSAHKQEKFLDASNYLSHCEKIQNSAFPENERGMLDKITRARNAITKRILAQTTMEVDQEFWYHKIPEIMVEIKASQSAVSIFAHNEAQALKEELLEETAQENRDAAAEEVALDQTCDRVLESMKIEDAVDELIKDSLLGLGGIKSAPSS